MFPCGHWLREPGGTQDSIVLDGVSPAVGAWETPSGRQRFSSCISPRDTPTTYCSQSDSDLQRRATELSECVVVRLCAVAAPLAAPRHEEQRQGVSFRGPRALLLFSICMSLRLCGLRGGRLCEVRRRLPRSPVFVHPVASALPETRFLTIAFNHLLGAAAQELQGVARLLDFGAVLQGGEPDLSLGPEGLAKLELLESLKLDGAPPPEMWGASVEPGRAFSTWGGRGRLSRAMRTCRGRGGGVVGGGEPVVHPRA